MIGVSLPFKMGEIAWEHQGEVAWDHPVLNIGSSYSSLKGEVKDWLDEHCQGSWHFGYNNRTYEVRFESQDDATLFKLRWT